MRARGVARLSAAAAALSVCMLVATPAAAAPTCVDLLAGKVFRCQVTTSFGRTFEDCYRFAAPGTRSPELDLVTDLVDDRFGCACQPRGTLKRPVFGVTKAFTCSGGGTSGLGCPSTLTRCVTRSRNNRTSTLTSIDGSSPR